MDQFEAYFRRADLDGDGRISGAEAVSFFQGSNLSKQVLAQVWVHADQNRTGFLTRDQFYNALRLVTVAQSKRDLTPDIVKAALYGPAAAKIPPPKINLPPSATPTPQQQPNQMTMPALPASQQMGAVGPNVSQGFGFRGPGVPNPGMGQQQYFPSQQGQLPVRPFTPQAIPQSPASRPIQGIPGMGGGMVGPSQSMPPTASPRPPQSVPAGTSGLGIQSPNAPVNWSGGTPAGNLAAPRGVTPMTPSVTSQLQSVSSQPTVTDSKALVVSGNGSATGTFFGDDVFSATRSAAKQQPSTSIPASTAPLPASSGIQPPVKSNSLESLQNAYASQPLGGGLQRTQSLPTTSQQVSSPSPSSISSSSISAGVGNSSVNSQSQWPKMKPTDIQKYTKVFMEVDTDRDGRITGEQARNLFLSWRLPIEVLKQIWDLSDQDSDSMLSLREFCFALYLMERYREGHPLPATLPSSVMLDSTLLSLTGQPKVNYGSPAWGPSSGFGQQPGMGPRPVVPAPGLRPPVPATAAQPDGAAVSNHQKPGAPVLEDSFLSQNENAEQNLNSMPVDGTAFEKKPDGIEKVILDSREKIEFYRTKMQDLVLYKSRCDNKLNEITERAIADKREAEMLGKKYEEKYKQVAEVASKLTIEEATFRDIQARKMELQQAIVNMEQGGSADGILQVRADRIQSDLDELMKALSERCKKHGLEIKSAALIELPIGWQPGIQEGAVVWDEEWDKFEDEGFTNDLTIDVKNDGSTKPKASPNGSLTPESLSNGDGISGNLFHTDDHESESADAQSEDELARSPHGSTGGRTALESPSQDFSDVFAKSEADAETHRSFDESTWGAFDTNDDVDSVWGFNPSSSKAADSEKHRDFFESDDFGVKPVKIESPSNQKRSPFFEDSVAGSPVSNRFSNSPRYSEAGDHFDSFSRFDSFSMHEGSGFSPRQDKLTRFDSINSTKDFSQGHAFSSFDNSDPFGSSGPFKVSSSENHSPRKSSDNWGF